MISESFASRASRDSILESQAGGRREKGIQERKQEVGLCRLQLKVPRNI